MGKTYINIAVRPYTHKRMLLFKIRAKVKNLDEAIRILLKAFQELNKR